MGLFLSVRADCGAAAEGKVLSASTVEIARINTASEIFFIVPPDRIRERGFLRGKAHGIAIKPAPHRAAARLQSMASSLACCFLVRMKRVPISKRPRHCARGMPWGPSLSEKLYQRKLRSADSSSG